MINDLVPCFPCSNSHSCLNYPTRSQYLFKTLMGKGKSEQAAVLGCCCCSIVLVGIILIVISFSSLEPNEAGIRYNFNTLQIDTKNIYRNGRYFLGVGQSFIKYSIKVENMRFSSTANSLEGPMFARTKDGLRIELEVGFNYQLTNSIEALTYLYLNFGEMDRDDEGNKGVIGGYKRIAKNVIRNVASSYDAFDFFLNRTQIARDMQSALDLELRDQHATVDSLQLLTIRLPNRFEDAKTRQEVAFQEIEQANNERRVAAINAKTSVDQAKVEIKVILDDAKARAEEIRLQNEANMRSLAARVEAEKAAYANLQQTLDLSQEELLAFIWLQAVQQSNVDGSVFSVPSPSFTN